MYRIYKEVKISAAHQLRNLPQEHPCSRLHGHNYRVEVWIEGEKLDEVGWLVDFGEISELVRAYDHKFLNDWFSMGNPTAENFAEQIRESLEYKIEQVEVKVKVRVWETDTSYAEVE